jgi:hypothetical protein
MAKIEIISRPVDYSEYIGNSEHLYYIYTLDNGDRFSISTLQDNTYESGTAMLTGNLWVWHEEYIQGQKDFNVADPIKNLPRQILLEGSDAEIRAKVVEMEAAGGRINDADLDYELPIAEAYGGNSGYDDQNSNTSAKFIADEVGFGDQVDNFVSENNLHVPGYQSHFNNYKLSKDFWDKKLEQNWNENRVVQQGSIKEGVPTVRLQDKYDRYEDYKISEIYDNLGGSNGKEVFNKITIGNLAKEHNTDIGDVGIGDYAFIDNNFYRKVGPDKYIKDNYPTYDSEADGGYVTINGTEYTKTSKPAGDILKSINPEAKPEDVESLNSVSIEVSANEGSLSYFIDKNIEVDCGDGNNIRLGSLINQVENGIRSISKFAFDQTAKFAQGYQQYLADHINDILSDFAMRIARGESMEDAMKDVAEF